VIASGVFRISERGASHLPLPPPLPSPPFLDPPAAEYPPNSPKKHRWPKIRRKKMRLAENPLNRKFVAAAEKNCGYCGAFNTMGC